MLTWPSRDFAASPCARLLAACRLCLSLLPAGVAICACSAPSLLPCASSDVSLNALVGTIPSELGRLSSLQTLTLFQNDISGKLPPHLGSLSRLIHLTAFALALSGAIPSELAGATALQSLQLQANMLTGQLPHELFARLGRLGSFQAQQNQLSGTLPSQIGAATALSLLDLTRNSVGGSIPTEIGLCAAPLARHNLPRLLTCRRLPSREGRHPRAQR